MQARGGTKQIDSVDTVPDFYLSLLTSEACQLVQQEINIFTPCTEKYQKSKLL
jgi:hypothetical protein